ncbi:hypothetical protein [Persicobacter diffluens]
MNKNLLFICFIIFTSTIVFGQRNGGAQFTQGLLNSSANNVGRYGQLGQALEKHINQKSETKEEKIPLVVSVLDIDHPDISEKYIREKYPSLEFEAFEGDFTLPEGLTENTFILYWGLSTEKSSEKYIHVMLGEEFSGTVPILSGSRWES